MHVISRGHVLFITGGSIVPCLSLPKQRWYNCVVILCVCTYVVVVVGGGLGLSGGRFTVTATATQVKEKYWLLIAVQPLPLSFFIVLSPSTFSLVAVDLANIFFRFCRNNMSGLNEDAYSSCIGIKEWDGNSVEKTLLHGIGFMGFGMQSREAVGCGASQHRHLLQNRWTLDGHCGMNRAIAGVFQKITFT